MEMEFLFGKAEVGKIFNAVWQIFGGGKCIIASGGWTPQKTVVKICPTIESSETSMNLSFNAAIILLINESIYE